MSYIKDAKLAPEGFRQIKWAEQHMPVLMSIREEFESEEPLKNFRIGFALHVTKETAVLVKVLRAGGAEVAIAGCNPLSTQDDVAAALALEGVNVFAWRGLTSEEYYQCIENVVKFQPQITVDDGCDLVTMIHTKRKDLLSKIRGGCEETTTGINRLRAMEKEGVLKYPIIDVNDAMTKHFFDNRYGTGQSTIDGILRATSILIAGKNFVVAGYGWCGRGVAMRARGMGANVIVTEVDPVKALEAIMDGFRVMPMLEAAKIGDIFVTTTGNVSIIRKEHLKCMKSGVILANSGHFNDEISIPDLAEISIKKQIIRPNTEEYTLENGNLIYLLAEGRLVNLSAAEGHPSEVMDMSFADQALSIKYLAKNKLEPKIYPVPKEIDIKVASLKLKTMGINIDRMNEEQREYLSNWKHGT